MIRKETWIVLALFVAALAGLLLWQRYGSAGDAEETPAAESTSLFSLGDKTVQFVRLERVGDRTVEFQRDDAGAWQIAWPQNQAADSAGLESTLGQLSSVTGEVMKNAPDLQAMGLEEPTYRLMLKLSDGSQLLADVGKATPTGGNYYVLGGDRRVYLVNSFSLDPILGLIDDLPLQPTATPATPPAEAYPSPETPGTEPAATQPVDAGAPAGTP